MRQSSSRTVRGAIFAPKGHFRRAVGGQNSRSDLLGGAFLGDSQFILGLLGAYYWVHMLRSLPDLPDQLLFEQLGGAKCTDFRIPFRVGKSLAECAGRYGSGIRGGSGIGPGRRVSGDKDGDSDLYRCEIDATPKPDTRVLTCIVEASSGPGC